MGTPGAEPVTAAQLLVVAGEASGDELAAEVVEQLPLATFGMGGPALARAGVQLVVSDLGLAGMGPASALRVMGRLWRAYRRLLVEVERRRPSAALLVGFSAFNARLGRQLRRRGVRVLWYAPPQVWAWRSARVHQLVHSCDQLALLFEFESSIWKSAGASAQAVGHPSAFRIRAPRQELRRALGLGPDETALAVLPGSRTSEVRRMLPLLLDSLHRVPRASVPRRALLLADHLPAQERHWAQELALGRGLEVLPGVSALPGFDVALATSGTVTLDCAVCQVPPVIAYRTDLVTAGLARHLLETPAIGLPNIVLGRRAFPELLQKSANPTTLANQVQHLLEHRQHYQRECQAVRARLVQAGSPTPAQQVAGLLRPWLAQ